MTWLEQHRLSERYASDAEVAKLRGEHAQVQELYAIAAQHEESALDAIASEKPRTYGIIAVSAVALHFKAAEFAEAKTLAYRCLASQRLPEFASRQIEDMLQSIMREQANVHLDDAQMLVSLKGGGNLVWWCATRFGCRKISEDALPDLSNHRIFEKYTPP